MPKRLSEKEIFRKGRFLIKDVIINLDKNKEVIFQYWDKKDTAMIVPITKEGNIIFITEYQAAIDKLMLSLPKGLIEEGELSVEIANKELQEEVGYKANNIKKIGEFFITPGYISGKTHIYLAQDLEESRLEGDEEWELPISYYPLNDFENLIESKQLIEARMISALYETKRILNKK